MKKVGNETFLYIGKAKNGVKARYKAADIKEFQIEAFENLINFPDNATALGVEQHIMNLNGWVNKASNIANRKFSNNNAAAIKDIYLKEGLKYLETNFPN